MSGERLLRFLASKKTTIPIWSCNKTETLCSLTVLNDATQNPSFRPLVMPRKFSTFPATNSALSSNRYTTSPVLKKSQLSAPNSSTYLTNLCSNVSNSAKDASKPLDIFAHGKQTSSITNDATSQSVPDGISINVHHGLPHLTVPLPSRNEKCVFVLRPITHTIGDLLDMLKTEDHGIDRAVIRNADGIRMAATTTIQSLLQSKSFDLVINETCYRVTPPSLDNSSSSIQCISNDSALSDDQIQKMGDVRLLVGQLYEVTENWYLLWCPQN